MRFVLAIVSFLLAAVLIGAGIAQKTIFAPPERVTESISVDSTAPVTIIDGATLNAFPRSQTVMIDGSPNVFAAYGRTTDVLAWVGDASYNTIGYDAEAQALTSETITQATETVPDPAGSDLWYQDYTSPLSLGFTVKVPNDISLIIVSDGQTPAPANVTLSWPLDSTTPWSAPLIVAGGVLLLLGLAFLVWAITHLRNARGPRRKQPKMPKMPKLPKPPRYKPVKQKALAPTSRGRRSTRTGMMAAPLVLVASLTLGACSAMPAATSTPEPTTSADSTQAVEPAAVEAPAIKEGQAKRIIADVAAVAAKADKANNAKLLSSRFAGPALERRTAAYKIHKADSKQDPLLTIPSGPVRVTLPSLSADWPRTVFAVVQGDDAEEVPTVAFMLIQDDPRANYKVHYVMNLEPGSVLPELASAAVGTARVPEDFKFLTLQPDQVAAAYGDILMKGKKSKSFALFDAEGDTLRTAVGVEAKKARQKKLPDTAKLTFANGVGTGQTVVMTTNDSGAIVAVELTESETVKPVESGAAVNAPKDVKALLGKSQSTKGIQAEYADQLLFYVPSLAAGGTIKLLGYSQGLIDASELKKKKN